MQPTSREMQGINSLFNSSQISLQDLHNNNRIQNSHMNINTDQHNTHFDLTSHDDFLDQILSNLHSSTWPDENPNKTDETAPSYSQNNVSPFPYDDQASLATKFRNHQINATSPINKAAATSLLLHHQLLMSRGVAGGDSGILQMPLSLGGNDVADGSSFKPSNPSGDEASVQALYNGFAGSLHGTGQGSYHTQHFQSTQVQNFQTSGGGRNEQAAPASGSGGQPRQRVRARRGQATDPHSIAERLRRERIAERMKALQELVPNANKTDKASMLDEIIDYVKFLQLQIKVLSMSRLGGAAAVAPLVADISSEGSGGCVKANGSGALQRSQTAPSTSNDNSLTMTEHQVAKLMEEDMGSAMQYLQGKGLCLMPISLATAISTSTCHTGRNNNNNHLTNGNNKQISNHNGENLIPTVGTNDERPLSPSLSVMTMQTVTVNNDNAVKDAASVSKP